MKDLAAFVLSHLVVKWLGTQKESVHGIFQARVLEWVAIAFSDIVV